METNNQKASCMICNKSVAVLKKYNLRRHCETKHLPICSKFSGMLRSEKFGFIKRSLESQKSLFMRKSAGNESIVRTIYKIVHKMAEGGNSFTDGNFIKKCMMDAANISCSGNAELCGSISL